VSELVDESALAETEDAATWRILVRSFWTLVLGEGAARVFGLAAVLLLARQLGPTGFGLAVVGMAFVARVALVSDAGTEMLTVRNVAREPERFRELAEKILGLRLALSVVSVAVYVAVVYAFTSSSYDRAVYLRFALALPAIALNLHWIVLGVRGERAVAAGNIAARLVFLVAVLALVVPTKDVMHVPYAYALGELAYALVIAAVVAPRFGVLRPRVDLAFWGATLRQSVPLMVSSLARGLAALELLVIGIVLGPRDAGYYGAGSKPYLFVATAIGLFYVSFVASYASISGPRALALFRRSARRSLAVAVVVALGFSIASEAVVPFLFGNRFSAAAPVLAIIVWQLPLSALASPYGGLLLVENRQLLLMRNALIVAAVALPLYVIAVELFGINGVAVVSVCAAAMSLGLNYWAAVSRGLAPRLRVVLERTAPDPPPPQPVTKTAP
jgi:O-antigen/teichoic acid export membrane protein